MPVEKEFGKAARLWCYRAYLGLRPEEMAVLLRVAPRSYQRWENGQEPIPVTLWADVDKIVAQFDMKVDDLVERAEQEVDDGSTQTCRVLVHRGAGGGDLPAGMWSRIVGAAMVEDPTIDPYFPEDKEENQ